VSIEREENQDPVAISQAEIDRRSDEARQKMRGISRKSFLWAGAAVLGAYGGFSFLNSRREQDGVIWPFRVALEANEELQRDLFAFRLAPTFDPAKALEPTVNFLDEEQDLEEVAIEDWQLSVEGLSGHDEPLVITMADLKKLPRVEQTLEFKCIEGWSTIVHWAGVLFSDFAAHYGPSTRNGDEPDVKRNPHNLLEYLAMESIEGLYYVGLDTLSAVHPQTLLAYEMNGKPLTMEHGAPLRLVIPTKYGVKNIKRIGTIRFTSIRPKDYWAEQGYDWYAGL
jgi:DMSO/TMAO reductase YedYZ molybdopterin-dependent catalytic subunit